MLLLALNSVTTKSKPAAAVHVLQPLPQCAICWPLLYIQVILCLHFYFILAMQ